MRKILKDFITPIFLVYVLTASSLGQVTEPEVFFSVSRGIYEDVFDLQISCTTAGAYLKYTIDGSDPTYSPTAIEASSPLTITVDPENTINRDTAPGFVVRTYALLNGSAISEVITHTYLFLNKIGLLSPDRVPPGPGWPEENTGDYGKQFINYGLDPDILFDAAYENQIIGAFSAIPTLSLVTDLENLFDADSGIYVNAKKHGIDWERPVSVELINPDGSAGFLINAGLRIRGGWSRHNDNPKHAFRLFFREEYGSKKLHFPLFGDEGVDEYDKLDLRTSQNYSWSFYGDPLNTMNRDVFSRDVQREMGRPYTRSRYYHLYINGTYWGLFQTQERPEASFAAEYLGGLEEEYDVIKIDIGEDWNVYEIEATDGTLDAWQRVWEVAVGGFYTDEDYYSVQGLHSDGSINLENEVLVDVDNLIDYMLCTFYVGDFDGPISNFGGNAIANNFYGIYNRTNPAGFKFFRHDAEHSLLDHPWGFDRTGPFPAGSQFIHFNPQWLHQQLVNHPEYLLRFSDRIYKHFFNEGIVTPESAIQLFLSRKDEIDLAIIAESARWGDSKTEPPRTRVDDWLPAINYIVEQFFPPRTDIVLQQLIDKGWYNNIEPPQFDLEAGIVTKGTALTLSAPQGKIFYTTDGSDPHLPYTVDGLGSIIVVGEETEKQFLVPTTDLGDNWKNETAYDISGWHVFSGAPGGIGYEMNTGYEELIGFDLSAEMFNDGSNPGANTTCYIRIPFDLGAIDTLNYTYMQLQIRYDDGFVAFINGTEVKRINAPAEMQWNSTATQNHEADLLEIFDISEYLDLLVSGENLLAIQGLNISTASSDFINLATLQIGSGSVGVRVSPKATEYINPISIDTHKKVRARVLVDDTWSPLNQIDLWVQEELNPLIISEIHYHPLNEGEIDDREFEFLEIKNTGFEPIDLSLAYFSDGISFSFPSATQIDPGSILVLASSAVYFEDRYGFAPFAEYTGQLDNAGEMLLLKSTQGDTLVYLEYDDNYPWPNSADGDGYSLVPVDLSPILDPFDPDSWRASEIIHGSPGEDEISEIQSDQTSRIKPQQFLLFQNYPNPFNPSTTIRYSLPRITEVNLFVYNLLGQKIKTLINKNQNAGYHAVIWDGTDDQGRGVSSGLYFYQLISLKEVRITKRMLLLK